MPVDPRSPLLTAALAGALAGAQRAGLPDLEVRRAVAPPTPRRTMPPAPVPPAVATEIDLIRAVWASVSTEARARFLAEVARADL